MAIVSSTSTLPANSSTAVYTLKTTLVSAGWTVTQSGTGTAGTYNSTGDSISSAAVLATANAWFLISSPNGQRFVFQNEANSTGWRIRWSGSGGTVSTDGTATASPTMASSVFVRGSAVAYTTWLPTNNTYRWHVVADNAAPYGFWCAALVTGGTESSHSGLVFDPLTATASGDVVPYVAYCAGPNFFLWAGRMEESNTGTSSTVSMSYYASTTPATSTTATMQPYGPFWYSPVAGSHLLMGGYLAAGGAFTSVAGPGSNPITGYDESWPVIWARRAAASGGNPGYKGVGTFMKFTGTDRTWGDTFTVNSTRDRINIGDFSLPWDGSIPSL
jgi:hypothetical protein